MNSKCIKLVLWLLFILGIIEVFYGGFLAKQAIKDYSWGQFNALKIPHEGRKSFELYLENIERMWNILVFSGFITLVLSSALILVKSNNKNK